MIGQFLKAYCIYYRPRLNRKSIARYDQLEASQQGVFAKMTIKNDFQLAVACDRLASNIEPATR